MEHDADALLDKMAGISFAVDPTRQDAITRGTHSDDDFDGEMDDASYHIESIEEKELPIDPINAYNHMAIYLRWCMEHDLMSVEFMERYWEQVQPFYSGSEPRRSAVLSPGLPVRAAVWGPIQQGGAVALPPTTMGSRTALTFR